MAVAIIASPETPVTTKGAKLSFALSGGGNFVRLWCTAAPLGSQLRQQIDASSSSREEIFSGDALPSSEPFLFKPDVPGKYTVVAQEYRRGATGYGGGYAGDRNGFSSETKIGSETTSSLVFGQRLTMQLGVSPDTATLVLYVWDDKVQATTFALHGERSPAIVSPSSDAAKNAAATLDTPTTMSAFVDQTATAILGSIDVVTVDMMNNFSAHFATTGSVHAAADPYNGTSTSYAFPTSKKATLKTVAELLTGLQLHMATDQSRRTPFVSSGQGTGSWHVVSGNVVADNANILIATPPTDMNGAYVAIADLWRAYEAHRQSTQVHTAADSANDLSSPPMLMGLHVGFLILIQSSSPLPAETENPGVPILVGGAGMKVS